MENIEVDLEDDKEIDVEAIKFEKKQRSELVFKNVVKPIEGVDKIDDLKKKVKIYFKFVPKKLLISHKGLVYIFDETKWPAAYKRYSDERMKRLKEERQKNNEDFFEGYLNAISNERKKPLKVKIFEDEEDKGDDDISREDSIDSPIKKLKKLSKEDEKKIMFTYLNEVIDDLKINFDEIKQLTDLIKLLNEKLGVKFKKNKNLVNKSKQLIYEPISLFIVNSFGKLIKVRNLSHLYEIVGSFEDRKSIYFNIMPFFEVNEKDKKVRKGDELKPEENVNQRPVHQNFHEENFDENFLGVDFLSTLDDISKDKVNLILRMFPDEDPKTVYDRIKFYEGDCDPVMEELLAKNKQEEEEGKK